MKLLRYIVAWIRYALRGFKRREIIEGFTYVRMLECKHESILVLRNGSVRCQLCCQSAIDLATLLDRPKHYSVDFVFGAREKR